MPQNSCSRFLWYSFTWFQTVNLPSVWTWYSWIGESLLEDFLTGMFLRYHGYQNQDIQLLRPLLQHSRQEEYCDSEKLKRLKSKKKVAKTMTSSCKKVYNHHLFLHQSTYKTSRRPIQGSNRGWHLNKSNGFVSVTYWQEEYCVVITLKGEQTRL